MGEDRRSDQYPKRLPAPDSEENTNTVLGWVTDLVRQGRLAWRLLWDKRVPFWTKLIPIATIAWVMPIIPPDIIPDAAPVLGQLDDIAILMLGMKLFVELAPTDIVREHLATLGARIQEWRVQEGEREPPPIIEGEYEIAELEEGEETGSLGIVEGEEVEAEIVEVVEGEEVEPDEE